MEILGKGVFSAERTAIAKALKPEKEPSRGREMVGDVVGVGDRFHHSS